MYVCTYIHTTWVHIRSCCRYLCTYILHFKNDFVYKYKSEHGMHTAVIGAPFFPWRYALHDKNTRVPKILSAYPFVVWLTVISECRSECVVSDRLRVRIVYNLPSLPTKNFPFLSLTLIVSLGFKKVGKQSKQNAMLKRFRSP